MKLNWTDEEIYQDKIKDCSEGEIGENGEIYSTENPNARWSWYQRGGRWAEMLIVAPGSQCDSALVKNIGFAAMKVEKQTKLRLFEEAKKRTQNKPRFFEEHSFFEELYPNERIYQELQTTFSTNAVVTPDGTWHEEAQGDWPCLPTPEDIQNWRRSYWDRFIVPAMENGWTMTIVDCNI